MRIEHFKLLRGDDKRKRLISLILQRCKEMNVLSRRTPPASHIILPPSIANQLNNLIN